MSDSKDYKIILRKNVIDLKKYDVKKEDVIGYKEALRTVSDMELIEILTDYDRLKKIEKKYEELVIKNIENKLDVKVKNFEINILKNKVNKLENVIEKLEDSLQLIDNRNLQKEREVIKSKLNILLEIVDNYYIDDVEIDNLRKGIVNIKDEYANEKNNTNGNNQYKNNKLLSDFLKRKGVSREEDLTEEDKFNFRFLKNR